METTSDADDDPRLSAHALDALQDFMNERNLRVKQFEELKAQAGDWLSSPQPLSIEAFSEDWNASQFWYDDNTATALARQLLDDATANTKIACVSAPSVFIQLENLLRFGHYAIRPEIKLFEFDERFDVFADYVPYDYVSPICLPPAFKGQFDRIICDPPFVSVDCLTKAALTVWWLAKAWNACTQRLIICTGERVEDVAHKLYGKAGVRTTDFAIHHANGLGNEYRCYANFEARGLWRWSDAGRVQDE